MIRKTLALALLAPFCLLIAIAIVAAGVVMLAGMWLDNGDAA